MRQKGVMREEGTRVVHGRDTGTGNSSWGDVFLRCVP